MSGPAPAFANKAYKKWSQGIADVFIEGLQDGTSPWVKSWDPGTTPPLSYNPVSGVRYRGGNQMALLFAEHDLGTEDRRWMTYKQALSIGAQVRKGEQGLMLMTWKEIEVTPEEGKEPDPDARKHLVALPFFVFNAKQIDGLPEPQAWPLRPLEERVAAAQKVVDDLGVPIHSGRNPFYHVPTDSISMPSRNAFKSDVDWMSTLLHECAHATGHPKRLDRKFGDDISRESYAREELRAEMASFEMCRRLGVTYDPTDHVSYVATWIKALKEDPAELVRAAAEVERILAYMKVPELDIEKIPVIEREVESPKQLPVKVQERQRERGLDR